MLNNHPKICMLVLILPLIASCKTALKVQKATHQHPNTVFNVSMFTSNVYIGVSPRMRLREREIDAARRHIAHQAAVRESCVVDLRRMRFSTTRDNIFFTDSNFDYNDPYIDELMENIEIINVFEFNELIVVIGMDSSKPSIPNTIVPRRLNGRPEWVDNPGWVRELLDNKYYVGVGVAEKYSMYYRGIFFADLGAAQAIASEKETYTYTDVTYHNINNTQLTESRTLILTENVELEGFYILDRWIEPDGSAYYSLGIARSRNAAP